MITNLFILIKNVFLIIKKPPSKCIQSGELKVIPEGKPTFKITLKRKNVQFNYAFADMNKSLVQSKY